MNIVTLIISCILSYLIGSIPTAYLLGRWLKGIDIREHGSGNVGATNAFRVLGKGPGIAVLLIDVIKGIISTTLIANMWGINDTFILVILGLITVAGHNWTIFLNFHGGKGIATTLGVLIGLTIQLSGLRPVLLVVVGVWVILFLVFGYVSLASLFAAVALPISMVMVRAPLGMIIMSIILCLFIVYRHLSNIKRLLQGKENRVRFSFFKK